MNGLKETVQMRKYEGLDPLKEYQASGVELFGLPAQLGRVGFEAQGLALHEGVVDDTLQSEILAFIRSHLAEDGDAKTTC